MVAYHDEEWGVPSHDDVHLFELLTLEGAQAGLSWSTILRKREGYRRAFSGFEPEIVARFGARDLARLVADEGIVRNRLKIESVVSNAHAVLRIKEEVVGGFAAYLWSHVDGAPLVGSWRSLAEIPAETAESRALSKDLKRRGFRFVGPTIVESFMEAVGLLDHHEPGCFRRGRAPREMRSAAHDAGG